MRLISQDDKVDIPYDRFVIRLHHVDNTKIIAFDALDTNPSFILMASYSSEAKELKVMEMIRGQYLDYCCNYHSKSGVFKFPADSEIEV